MNGSARSRMVSCPFHEDDTPSVAIDREERFFCFECKRAGYVRDLPTPRDRSRTIDP